MIYHRSVYVCICVLCFGVFLSDSLFILCICILWLNVAHADICINGNIYMRVVRKIVGTLRYMHSKTT